MVFKTYSIIWWEANTRKRKLQQAPAPLTVPDLFLRRISCDLSPAQY